MVPTKERYQVAATPELLPPSHQFSVTSIFLTVVIIAGTSAKARSSSLTTTIFQWRHPGPAGCGDTLRRQSSGGF